MSDNLFNYTFNINTVSSQGEVLDALDKGRHFPPAPKSFFFADLNNFPIQVTGDGFGPVEGYETSRFRLTSKFNITTPKKAYATTAGRLFFAPFGDTTDKVNVFLKPTTPVDVGVKIKYFVYRGIKMDSLFKIYSEGLRVIERDDPKATVFLKRIWAEYLKYNDIAYSSDTIFKAEEFGYSDDPDGFGEITEKFFKDNIFNLPLIQQGEEFGSFEDTMGFEIVVDFGDYEQETNESGFDFNFAYANAKECVLNLTGNNEAFVYGNLPSIPSIYTGASPKIFKENIYHFLDPAAFYGAHISQNDATPHGQIASNITFEQDKISRYQDSVYFRFVSKFSTRNKIYLYILGKRGRSYNFYNETPFSETTGPIQPAPNSPAPYPPPEDFSTYGWPLKIFDSSSSDYLSYFLRAAADSKVRLRFLLNYLLPTTESFLNNCFYIRDSFNLQRFRIFEVEDNVDNMRVELESPLYKPSEGSNQLISKFLYPIYTRNLDYSKYYNDLIGPIDVSGLFEPEDFSNAKMIQWLTYKKPKMYHMASSNIIAEMKVVFEGAGDASDPSTDSRTRLYVIYPIDSNDPNFKKRAPFTSGCDLVTKTNTFTRLVYENVLNKERSDIRIWKGTVLDNNNEVSVLAVRNLMYDSDNVGDIIQLGLTEAEYTRLITDAPDELKFNMFFNLTEDTVGSMHNYQRFQLGIAYDDSEGNLVTFTNTTDPVLVYSMDGKFFATDNYASQFEHAETFGNVAVEFLPYTEDPVQSPVNDEWHLKYGFDWMRKVDENYKGQNFPPFRGIIGTIPAQTDGNDPTSGTFVPDRSMYNDLKVREYNAIPLNWRIDNSDRDTEYFSAWLSLVKDNDKIYTVRLRIKSGNSLPQSLRISYNTSLLKLSCPLDPKNSSHQDNANSNAGPNQIVYLNLDMNQLVANSYNETILNITLKVPNSGAIPFDKRLVFMSAINGETEKIAGILNLFADYTGKEKKEEKLLFVPISLQLPTATVSYSQAQLSSQIPLLRNYLRQALIDVDVEWHPTTLDIGSLPDAYHNTANGVTNIIGVNAAVANFIPLNQYLKQILGTKGRRVVFFINNIGGNFNDSGIFNQLGGFATGIGSDVVMFKIAQNDETTLAHEVLHSLGIPHTFSRLSKNSLYVYKGLQTDNIMDYTSVTRSTYHWQWLIARKNVNKTK